MADIKNYLDSESLKKYEKYHSQQQFDLILLSIKRLIEYKFPDITELELVKTDNALEMTYNGAVDKEELRVYVSYLLSAFNNPKD